MYIWFSENRMNYKNGQIAPFLIAMTAVMIVLFMITVNLGKIAEYQVDVSNAADAAALATASVLSGQLLSLGIRSDAMVAYALIMFIGMAFSLIRDKFPGDVITAIIMYITGMVHQYTEYITALGAGRLAWTNAKKTGVQYGFSNIGVSAPKPTFEQFMRNVYNISPEALDAMAPSQLAPYYEVYANGDDPTQDNGTRLRIKWNSTSNYSLFMGEDEGGYWNNYLGKMDPGSMSKAIITSGYGWTINDDDTVSGSFSPSALRNTDYKSFNNYAEIQLIGGLMYPLEVLQFMEIDFFKNVIWTIFWMLYNSIGWLVYFGQYEDSWWGAIIASIICVVVSIIFAALLFIFPAGLKMENIVEQTDLNYITVSARKAKQSEDMGMWEFTYEGSVMRDRAFEGRSTSHVFGEPGPDGVKPDVTPSFPYEEWGWNRLESEMLGRDPEDPEWGWFDTRKHLFESELVEVWM